MKNWKSKELLLCNSEAISVDAVSSTLPAEVNADAKLLQNTAQHNSDANSGDCSDTKKARLTVHVPEATQSAHATASNSNSNRAVDDAVDLEALFKRHKVWYRNWTNMGVALCILYNLCIVFLLLMGFFKFTQS